MEIPVSTQTAELRKKANIKKGYYPAILREVKPRQKNDGILVESQYGHQLVFMFEILDPEKKLPMSVPAGEGVTETLWLPLVVYYEYKEKDGSYRTAMTPNAKITHTAQALGWEFDAKHPFVPEKLIGEWVELNIDDYDAKLTDRNGTVKETYVASGIQKVAPWKEEKTEVPESKPKENKSVKKTVKNAKAKEEVVADDPHVDKRNTLKELLDAGSLTKEGYDMAIKQLDSTKK